MNSSILHQKLISVARNNPPSSQVPYAFEKRVMAHIRSMSPVVNKWSLWAKPLWQAALSCVVVTVLCGIWSFASTQPSDADILSQDFENTVCSTMNVHVEDAW